MISKFYDALRKYNMISPGDRILVGVSGGADSMCLLHILYSLKDELDITVSAAHVNHMIRGAEADRDEETVRQFCKELDIPFYCTRIDIPKLAREQNLGTELCARNERYRYFNSLEFDKIATAHTGSDCIETMLMNLSRGASLKGLCSIPPVRGNIIRPLILFTRSDTEKYCEQNNIKYVIDSTNLTEDYTRNKYRLSVLALLKNINVSFEQNALRCLAGIREDEEYLEGESDILFNKAFIPEKEALSTAFLKDSPKPPVTRVIRRYLDDVLHTEFDAEHINTIFENINSDFSLTLPGNIEVQCTDGILKRKEICRIFDSPESITVDNYNNFSCRFGDTNIEISSVNNGEISENETVIDSDKIKGNLIIRSRNSGDKIFLSRYHCNKKLKQLFTECKISPEKRNLIPVICDSENIICVAGIGTSAKYTADKNTKNFLKIKWSVNENDE